MESLHHFPPEGGTLHVGDRAHVLVSRPRRGKAAPVDYFTGKDWLPSLERAKMWNDWTEDELKLQLAGYLCGRAHQEWSLLDADTKMFI